MKLQDTIDFISGITNIVNEHGNSESIIAFIKSEEHLAKSIDLSSKDSILIGLESMLDILNKKQEKRKKKLKKFLSKYETPIQDIALMMGADMFYMLFENNTNVVAEVGDIKYKGITFDTVKADLECTLQQTERDYKVTKLLQESNSAMVPDYEVPSAIVSKINKMDKLLSSNKFKDSFNTPSNIEPSITDTSISTCGLSDSNNIRILLDLNNKCNKNIVTLYEYIETNGIDTSSVNCCLPEFQIYKPDLEEDTNILAQTLFIQWIRYPKEILNNDACLAPKKHPLNK